MHVLWIMLIKTRGNKYFNAETWMLFFPYQNFWLRAWLSDCKKWNLLYLFSFQITLMKPTGQWKSGYAANGGCTQICEAVGFV